MKSADENRSYVAFLRGINVGGHKPIRMEALKKAFVKLGFKNVRTVLASGNALFDAPPETANILAKKIEDKLEKTFGHEVGVLVRTIAELQRLARTDPFQGIEVTPQTRLYVTFLSERPKGLLKIPYASPGGYFRILRASGKEARSVLTLSPEIGTVDLMGVLEKEFGRKITTRNWNTVLKILAARQ